MGKLTRFLAKPLNWLLDMGTAVPDEDTAGTKRDKQKMRKAADGFKNK